MISKEEILKDIQEKYEEVWERYCKQGYAGKQLLHIMSKDYYKLREFWSVLRDEQRQLLVSKIISIYDHLKVPKKKEEKK